MRTLAAVLLLSLTLSACTDPFSEAQQADTIESYEKYLADNPSGAYRLQAEMRLEELMLQKARDEKSLEGFDAYLARFPKGSQHDKAVEERESFLFSWAEEQDTPAAYQKYLDEYPKGDKKRKEEARRRMVMAEHKDKISISAPEQEQVNLAGEQDGVPNGWAFFVDVTNQGDQPITRLTLQLRFLNESGRVIKTANYPSVGSRYPGRSWVEDEYKEPLKPGQTRQWKYTTGDIPPNWAQKVEVKAIDISFDPVKE